MNPVLETSRFCLRLPTAADAPAIAAFYHRNREHADRWSPAREPEYFTPAYWAVQARRDLAAAGEGTAYRFWAFSGGEAVGTVVLRAIVYGANRSAELGYSIDTSHCGQGIATELAQAAIRFAFDELRLHRIEAVYMPANLASKRVLEKLGFQYEGVLRDMLFVEGRWEDHVVASLINPND